MRIFLFSIIGIFTFVSSPYAAQKNDSSSQIRQKRLAQKRIKDRSEKEKNYGLQVEYQIGLNLNPGFDATFQNDIENNIYAAGYYRFVATNRMDMKFLYSLQKTWFRDHPDDEYGDHRIALPLSYYTKRSRFSFNPEFSLDFYGDALFSRNISSLFEYMYRKTRSIYLATHYRFTKISVVSDSDASLSGFIHELLFSFKKIQKKSILYSSFAFDKYDYEDSLTSVSSYYAVRGFVSKTWFWREFDLNANLGIEFRFYSLASSDSLSRKDQKLTSALQFGWNLNQSMRTFTQIEFARNLSNFDSSSSNTTYSSGRWMIGLTAGI